jgi:hypothetical protein
MEISESATLFYLFKRLHIHCHANRGVIYFFAVARERDPNLWHPDQIATAHNFRDPAIREVER